MIDTFPTYQRFFISTSCPYISVSPSSLSSPSPTQLAFSPAAAATSLLSHQRNKRHRSQYREKAKRRRKTLTNRDSSSFSESDETEEETQKIGGSNTSSSRSIFRSLLYSCTIQDQQLPVNSSKVEAEEENHSLFDLINNEIKEELQSFCKPTAATKRREKGQNHAVSSIIQEEAHSPLHFIEPSNKPLYHQDIMEAIDASDAAFNNLITSSFGSNSSCSFSSTKVVSILPGSTLVPSPLSPLHLHFLDLFHQVADNCIARLLSPSSSFPLIIYEPLSSNHSSSSSFFRSGNGRPSRKHARSASSSNASSLLYSHSTRPSLFSLPFSYWQKQYNKAVFQYNDTLEGVKQKEREKEERQRKRGRDEIGGGEAKEWKQEIAQWRERQRQAQSVAQDTHCLLCLSLLSLSLLDSGFSSSLSLLHSLLSHSSFFAFSFSPSHWSSGCVHLLTRVMKQWEEIVGEKGEVGGGREWDNAKIEKVVEVIERKWNDIEEEKQEQESRKREAEKGTMQERKVVDPEQKEKEKKNQTADDSSINVEVDQAPSSSSSSSPLFDLVVVCSSPTLLYMTASLSLVLQRKKRVQLLPRHFGEREEAKKQDLKLNQAAAEAETTGDKGVAERQMNAEEVEYHLNNLLSQTDVLVCLLSTLSALPFFPYHRVSRIIQAETFLASTAFSHSTVVDRASTVDSLPTLLLPTLHSKQCRRFCVIADLSMALLPVSLRPYAANGGWTLPISHPLPLLCSSRLLPPASLPPAPIPPASSSSSPSFTSLPSFALSSRLVSSSRLLLVERPSAVLGEGIDLIIDARTAIIIKEWKEIEEAAKMKKVTEKGADNANTVTSTVAALSHAAVAGHQGRETKEEEEVIGCDRVMREWKRQVLASQFRYDHIYLFLLLDNSDPDFPSPHFLSPSSLLHSSLFSRFLHFFSSSCSETTAVEITIRLVERRENLIEKIMQCVWATAIKHQHDARREGGGEGKEERKEEIKINNNVEEITTSLSSSVPIAAPTNAVPSSSTSTASSSVPLCWFDRWYLKPSVSEQAGPTRTDHELFLMHFFYINPLLAAYLYRARHIQTGDWIYMSEKEKQESVPTLAACSSSSLESSSSTSLAATTSLPLFPCCAVPPLRPSMAAKSSLTLKRWRALVRNNTFHINNSSSNAEEAEDAGKRKNKQKDRTEEKEREEKEEWMINGGERAIKYRRLDAELIPLHQRVMPTKSQQQQQQQRQQQRGACATNSSTIVPAALPASAVSPVSVAPSVASTPSIRAVAAIVRPVAGGRRDKATSLATGEATAVTIIGQKPPLSSFPPSPSTIAESARLPIATVETDDEPLMNVFNQRKQRKAAVSAQPSLSSSMITPTILSSCSVNLSAQSIGQQPMQQHLYKSTNTTERGFQPQPHIDSSRVSAEQFNVVSSIHQYQPFYQQQQHQQPQQQRQQQQIKQYGLNSFSAPSSSVPVAPVNISTPINRS